jgi:hypothetical protein
MPKLRIWITILAVLGATACEDKASERMREAEANALRQASDDEAAANTPRQGTDDEDEAAGAHDDVAADQTIDKKSYAPPEPTPRDAEGAVLESTTILNPQVETVDDLARLFPLPDDYRYELAEWGQPIVRRVSDGAAFSFLAGERMLRFNSARRDGEKMVYDTAEVFHIDAAEAECTREEWKIEGGGCVTGFANPVNERP